MVAACYAERRSSYQTINPAVGPKLTLAPIPRHRRHGTVGRGTTTLDTSDPEGSGSALQPSAPKLP